MLKNDPPNQFSTRFQIFRYTGKTNRCEYIGKVYLVSSFNIYILRSPLELNTLPREEENHIHDIYIYIYLSHTYSVYREVSVI
jgi:hypothetical protein